MTEREFWAATYLQALTCGMESPWTVADDAVRKLRARAIPRCVTCKRDMREGAPRPESPSMCGFCVVSDAAPLELPP